MTLTFASTLFLLAILSLSSPSPSQQPTLPAALSGAPTPAQDAAGNYQIGGGVTAPRVIFAPEPEFSEKARKKKIAGNCTVSLVVDATGHVTQAHVVHSIAEGQSHGLQDAAHSLDEKALEAVRKYRFEPASLDGKPVPVTITIEVNFQIF